MNNAVQLYKGELSLITRAMPRIVADTDIILKVSYAGVSRQDLRTVNGEVSGVKKKLVLGREVAGIVIEMGKKVTHLKVGDRVVVNPRESCQTCHYCEHGHTQFCDTAPTLAVNKDGGWQQYLLLSGRCCHLLPVAVPLKSAVLCVHLSCVMHMWNQHLNAFCRQDTKILVSGASVEGLMWAAVLHHYGLRDVTLIDVSDERRKGVARLGCDFEVHDPEEMNVRQLEHNTDTAWGYDLIIDCTGKKVSMEESFYWLRKGSKFIMFTTSSDTSVTLEHKVVCDKQIQVIGVPGDAVPLSFSASLKLLEVTAKRYFDLPLLNAKVLSLQDYERAVSKSAEHEASKIVFQMHSE